MRFSSAYLLVFHGSRDPRPRISIEHLAQQVARRLQPGGSLMQNSVQVMVPWVDTASVLVQSDSGMVPPVGVAELELNPLPLHQQIYQFAERIISQGYTHLQILPVFLLPGVHVMEDIPAEVNLAHQALGSCLSLEIRPYLGSHPGLKNLLLHSAELTTSVPINTAITSKILLAHGSRRTEGNQPVEAIASELEALPAYWSVPPSLEAGVSEWVKKGSQQIAILPYFLFEGGITDAIVREVTHLAQQFPYVQLHLGRAIGPSPQLAELVTELFRTH